MQTTRRSFLQQFIQPTPPSLSSAHSLPAARITKFVEVDPVQHLVTRATWGMTPEVLSHAQTIGLEAWLDEQLNPERIADTKLDQQMKLQPIWKMSRRDIHNAFSDQDYEVTDRIRKGIFTRAVYSEKQLLERVVDFWRDHFNISDESGYATELLLFERNVLYKHALGNFRDLLIASAGHPAMLVYLDNFVSEKEAPNENYARELLELHTLGVDGAYTEEDIREVARALTGWTIHPGTDDGFFFDEEMHDTGRKLILGHRFPAGRGIEDGLHLLSLVARHPDTARFISTKLCRRFVSDHPPATLIDSTTQVWKNTDGNIQAVLRHIFLSAEFQQSVGQKYMRPFEYVVAIFRATDNRVTDWYVIEEMLTGMGQIPHGWHPPNGYPDVAGAWINTGGLLNRWNAAMYLTHSAYEDVDNGWGVLSNLDQHIENPKTAGELVDQIAVQIWGISISATVRGQFANYVSDGAGVDAPLNAHFLSRKMASTFGLMFASPYFQWR
ncbi:MAG: hypothetical protein ACI9EW_001836 [Cellvibrionaceae bacterium]|jgi:uncharacterized protein (DUF1800 family)